MVQILAITHEREWLFTPDGAGGAESSYMLGPVLRELAGRGHEVRVARGTAERFAADIAIMHVDLTRVPPDYVELGRSYPICLNLDAADVSKRAVSGALLAGDDPWDGPVIVKKDLNFGGFPEMRLEAAERGVAVGPRADDAYPIFPSRADVPDALAGDPALVIEKFLSEQVDGGYATRFWTFLGKEERCSRVFSDDPVVKASGQTRFEFVDVPAALRARRAELGFDYGKFDFVMHAGEPVLIDANKTPGTPPVPKGATWPQDFARGLLGRLR